jgi:hypothetical protein
MRIDLCWIEDNMGLIARVQKVKIDSNRLLVVARDI